MISDFQKAVINLIKSAITGESVVLPQQIDMKAIYNYAMKNQLVSLIYYGLENNKNSVTQTEWQQQFFISTCQMINISENQMYQVNRICDLFEKNKIDYMPLKGIVLKKIFPHSEMRIMGDADILIRPKQYPIIKKIFTAEGFTENAQTDHEYIWTVGGILHLELHKCLFSEYNVDFYGYYGNGWCIAKKKSLDSTCYMLRKEDTFIYLLTHMVKHFRAGGIGVKHLVDLYAYCYFEKNLDEEYITKELKLIGLEKFYSHICRTIDYCFYGGDFDETIGYIINKLFDSGPYGKNDDRKLWIEYRNHRLSESSLKFLIHQVLQTIFLPYPALCVKYPHLKKAPFLMPVYTVRRWIYAIMRPKRIITRIHNFEGLSKDINNSLENDLEAIDLQFKTPK